MDIETKAFKLAIISLIIAIFSLVLPVTTTTLTGNNTTINNTTVNNIYYNNTTGTTSHANLTDLNWSSSNHTIDTSFDLNNNNLINCNNCISYGNYTGNNIVNRSIAHGLVRKPKIITVIKDTSSVASTWMSIYDGYFVNLITGSYTAVPTANETNFSVTGSMNDGTSLFTTEIGSTSTTDLNQVGWIYWFPITPTNNGTVINLSINVQTPVGNWRVALYNNSGTQPYKLLNESASIPTASGWNNHSVIVNVTAGTQYWIADQYSSNSNRVYSVDSGTLKYAAQAYGTFPSTAPALSDSVRTHNMRMSVLGQISTYYWVAQ